MNVETVPLLSKNQAVNHDVINSLSSVCSLSELLVDYPGLDTDDRIRFLKLIHQETERLTRLLANVKLSPDVAESL